MARHFVGGGGNAFCKGLQNVMHAGVDTNGALADWLVQRNLPITNQYLGKILADALKRALQENPVGRDEKLKIPLRKKPTPTGDAAPEDAAAPKDGTAAKGKGKKTAEATAKGGAKPKDDAKTKQRRLYSRSIFPDSLRLLVVQMCCLVGAQDAQRRRRRLRNRGQRCQVIP
ncbi:hypothetical protein AURDEDRAFT_115291 [Auricularia subglabra TFB-10046 SS5]|nr:hypothetical protein AURDEDRAFT_115291 [Auricularia subglabra TFB-10046 SS5]